MVPIESGGFEIVIDRRVTVIFFMRVSAFGHSWVGSNSERSSKNRSNTSSSAREFGHYVSLLIMFAEPVTSYSFSAPLRPSVSKGNTFQSFEAWTLACPHQARFSQAIYP